MMNEETAPSRNVVSQFFKRISQLYQLQLDRWTPHTRLRWAGAIVLILLFLLRVFTQQGWYIVTYALGIYHLNLFIAFLTPKIDPALDLDDDQGPELPTKANEEFRPFIRRLPEFKFWYAISKSTVIGIICTFFEVFNVPVFWPILVMYFITLFCITMKRQIRTSGTFVGGIENDRILPEKRWTVTGTPIEKSMDNLYGLVYFLDYE